MTIEINRRKSVTVYRINPYAATEIDYKRNQHKARWLRYASYATPQEATTELLKLERNEKEGNQ